MERTVSVECGFIWVLLGEFASFSRSSMNSSATVKSGSEPSAEVSEVRWRGGLKRVRHTHTHTHTARWWVLSSPFERKRERERQERKEKSGRVIARECVRAMLKSGRVIARECVCV